MGHNSKQMSINKRLQLTPLYSMKIIQRTNAHRWYLGYPTIWDSETPSEGEEMGVQVVVYQVELLVRGEEYQ